MPSEETTTIMVNGNYTCYASLSFDGSGEATDDDDGHVKLAVKGFNAAFHKTKVFSSGVWRFAKAVNKIEQHRPAYFQDVPTVDLSLNFELEKKLLKKFFEILSEKRNAPFTVEFHDPDSKLDWKFDYCYLTSFNFSVDRDSILEVALGFFTYVDHVSYGWQERNIPKDDLYIKKLPLKDPIAYYEWKVTDKNGSEIPDITGFSFDFSQTVTPKYECAGNSSPSATPAEHLLFGMPEMGLSITKFLHKEHKITFDEEEPGTKMGNRKEFDDSKLTFALGDDVMFSLSGVDEQDVTPSFFSGTYMEYTTVYTVHGKLLKD